jgi:hypothetical protein
MNNYAKEWKELNRHHQLDIVSFANGHEMSFDLFNALFTYYCNSNEMPYGVAKARTGDPYEWVATQFRKDLPCPPPN